MTPVRNAQCHLDDAVCSVRASILIDHPAQHFSRAFQLLSQQSAVCSRVYYWTSATDGLLDKGFGRHVRWNADLHSGYDWWAPASTYTTWRRGLALVHRLRQYQPQVILCYGWNTPVAWLGILFAAFTGTPLLYYGDSTWQHSAGTWNGHIRKIVLRTLFRLAAGAISTGTFNREFYILHGLDPARVYPGVCPADTESFSAEIQRPSGDAGSNEDNRPVIIGFAGKFLTNKAPQDLIDAASRLPRDKCWELWLIGDGPLRSELESQVSERGLTDRVRFHGFKNTDELPPLMRATDVMVVPSRKDLRVLVTIEAMAAGSALVVSSGTAVWGPGDLIQDDQTGLVYPAGDVDALAGCLRRLIDEPDLRKRLAKSGRARALSFGPQDFAEMTAAALVSAARKHRHVRDDLDKRTKASRTATTDHPAERNSNSTDPAARFIP